MNIASVINKAPLKSLDEKMNDLIEIKNIKK